MNSNYLKLELERDADGSCELKVEVYSNGYSGVGSAWIGCENLLSFASKLKTYPILKESPIELIVGYLNKNNVRELKDTHFSFKAYPIGAKGNIGVHVRVSTSLGTNERPERQHVVEIEILTLYNELERFAKQLEELVEGNVNQAILEEAK